MKVFFLITAVLYAVSAFAQPAKVLAVSGHPYRASGQSLKTGDKLKEGESVLFAGNTDTLVVLVLGKGLGYYTPGKDPRPGAARSAEWRYFVRDISWVKDEGGRLTGRGNTINSRSDLQQFFNSYNTPASSLLVIDRLELPVGRGLEKDLSNGYFFLQYMRPGDTINKKLLHRLEPGTKTSQLVMDTSVLRVDNIAGGAIVREKCTLHVYDRMADSSYQLTAFYTSVIRSEVIRPSICLLKTEAGNWEALANDFLTWQYGTPDKNAIHRWLTGLSCH